MREKPFFKVWRNKILNVPNKIRIKQISLVCLFVCLVTVVGVAVVVVIFIGCFLRTLLFMFEC